MRFSSTIALALPLLASAQQDPLNQIKEQAAQYYAKFSSYIPNPNKFDAAGAAAAKAAGYNVEHLSLDNWKETLQPPTKAYTNGPEEWWVLVTGHNKTCYGLCEQVERSFNESAALFAVQKDSPHLAILNCDQSPILCNSWSAGPPYLWIMEIGAPGTPVPIHRVRLNTTTTTVSTYTDLKKTESWRELEPYNGYFHPFDGKVAELGLSVPMGYLIWIFAIVPSWALMIGISFVSRTIM